MNLDFWRAMDCTSRVRVNQFLSKHHPVIKDSRLGDQVEVDAIRTQSSCYEESSRGS